jgi:hypothetical protein
MLWEFVFTQAPALVLRRECVKVRRLKIFRCASYRHVCKQRHWRVIRNPLFTFLGSQGSLSARLKAHQGVQGLTEHRKLSTPLITHNAIQFKKSKLTENIIAFKSTLSYTFMCSGVMAGSRNLSFDLWRSIRLRTPTGGLWCNTSVLCFLP